jgi:hypothetical protein
MFELFRYIISIILGETEWPTFFRIIVIFLSLILVPLSLFLDITFGILYAIVDVYYRIVDF